MNEIMVDPNKSVIFHPVAGEEAVDEHRQKIAEHVSTHYRKYLFGIGALCGFTISLFARVFFGTSTTIQKTSAAYEAYASLVPEVNAIIVFNEMDAIAHVKDNFFHQTGKIYSLTGETLFHKYDTMFHVLDNAYHRSIDTQEKLKRAKRMEAFLKEQNTIFDSTKYANTEQDARFNELDKQFLETIASIEEVKNREKSNEMFTGEEKTLTGTKIAQ